MKKFIRKFIILSIFTAAPLALTGFNKPTFAMESTDSSKQTKEEKKSTTTKQAKSKKEIANLAKEKEPSKKKATKKTQSVKDIKSPPKTKSKKKTTKKPKSVEISDEELVMFFQQAEEKEIISLKIDPSMTSYQASRNSESMKKFYDDIDSQ